MSNPFQYGSLLLVVAGGVIWVYDLSQGAQLSRGILVMTCGLLLNVASAFWTLRSQ